MNSHEPNNQKISSLDRIAWWKEVQKNSDHRTSQENGLRKKGEACPIKNCQRKVATLGLCNPHYQRLKKNGDLQIDRPVNCKSGAFNPKWRGGEIKIHDNRTLIYVPDHPYPSHSGGKHVLRYRLVMEKHLGRYLLPHEVVHHKNGDCTDDRIENLELLNQAEHARIHSCCNQWSRKHDKCVSCGTIKTKHTGKGFCQNCHARERRKQTQKTNAKQQHQHQL